MRGFPFDVDGKVSVHVDELGEVVTPASVVGHSDVDMDVEAIVIEHFQCEVVVFEKGLFGEGVVALGLVVVTGFAFFLFRLVGVCVGIRVRQCLRSGAHLFFGCIWSFET